MEKHHHVDVACSDELWRNFKARCTMEGVELRVRVAQLVAAHMGVNPATGDDVIPGQQELPEPAGSRKAGRKPRKASAARTAPRKAVSATTSPTGKASKAGTSTRGRRAAQKDG